MDFQAPKSTMEMKKSLEKVKAEELISRFRSKEDIHRYLVQ
jgi:hypothetical protein